MEAVLAGWRILGVGPRTIELFQEELASAKMVLWNGPLGGEMDLFPKETFAIASTLAELDAETVIGGRRDGGCCEPAGHCGPNDPRVDGWRRLPDVYGGR